MIKLTMLPVYVLVTLLICVLEAEFYTQQAALYFEFKWSQKPFGGHAKTKICNDLLDWLGDSSPWQSVASVRKHILKPSVEI